MSDDGFLKFEDEVALAAPLRLPHDDPHVCDRRGCGRRAEWIVPGAVLCGTCAEEFGIERNDTYSVPLAELAVSDWRFIRARTEEYAALLAEYRERLLIPATPDRKTLIDDLIRDAADQFIRSCGGVP